LQAVLFEIQLIKSRSAASSAVSTKRSDAGINYKHVAVEHYHDNLRPEDAAGTSSSDQSAMARRGSQGIKSILLKGEMRYLKEIDVLIFLCSPL
jgi:guanylate cyclase